MKLEEINKELVYEKLRELGETPDDVAATLMAKGVRGLRNNCRECPVANYLVQVLQPESFGVTILGEYVHLIGLTGPTLAVVHPEPVRGFIRNFDKFGYRDLGNWEEPAGQ